MRYINLLLLRGQDSAKNIFVRRRSKNFSALQPRPVLLNGCPAVAFESRRQRKQQRPEDMPRGRNCFCSAARTRTWNQLLTRQSRITAGVDYIIAGSRRFGI